jgi:uncharacterized membrane protein YoaK (UPF0700 family)
MATAPDQASIAAAGRAARAKAAILEGTLLAFVAGFVDTCGFVALFGLFTAHVTGNLVLIGAAIVAHHGGLIAKLLALPVFVLTVALSRYLSHQLQDRERNPAAYLLGLQLLFLLAFLACGVATAPIDDADAPLAILTGMLAVTAMAIQNAASRTAFQMHTPTTVMTGNMTQIVIDLVDIGLGRGLPDARLRIKKMAPAILAFAVGAMAGALSYTTAGFWCLILPIGVLAIVFARETGRAA